MTEYFDGTSGNKIAYNKITGSSPGLVFLGGFMSDMEGSKAMFLESYAKETGQGYLSLQGSFQMALLANGLLMQLTLLIH